MKKIFFFLTTILFLGCAKKAFNQHSSRTSLDWAGTYRGSLLEEGKESNVVITLYDNNTFSLSSAGKAEHAKGDIIWSKNGSSITLATLPTATHFFVAENMLIPANSKGERLKNDAYFLTKLDGNSVVEKYWKLLEINGQLVSINEGSKEPHIILKAHNNSLIGNAGCNNIMGNFELNQEGGVIKFSKVASTMMACQDMETEGKLLKALPDVDSFTTDGEHLNLSSSQNGTTLKFKAVYLY